MVNTPPPEAPRQEEPVVLKVRLVSSSAHRAAFRVSECVCVCASGMCAFGHAKRKAEGDRERERETERDREREREKREWGKREGMESQREREEP